LGSVAELDTQLLITKELNFLLEKDFNEISEKLNIIGKMLSGLIKYRQSKL
jgi:four helix bundle protein